MSALAEHVHTLRAMWEHPRGSRATLTAFQNRKLARPFTHTYENVVHYRRLFDRNLAPT